MEQDYVDALAARFSGEANPDYKKLSLAYASKMKTLSEKYPDDLDASTLYAESLMDLNPWKLWSLDGKPAENTEEIVRVLESVLERDPNHVGANHFYIHAVEASPHPERALPSAKRLDTLVPQAGHLVHMPSHIYARTGYYEEAVKSNVEAAKVDRVYAQKAEQEGSMYDLMYHSHNEHFLVSAASMEGRYAEAKAAADALAAKACAAHGRRCQCSMCLSSCRCGSMRALVNGTLILAKPEPAENTSRNSCDVALLTSSRTLRER